MAVSFEMGGAKAAVAFLKHPWVIRAATFGRRAIWELRGGIEGSGCPIFEGAEFQSEEELQAASSKHWRDLVSGGSVFKEFLCHKENGSGGPFASWEEAEGWLLAA